MRIDKFLRNARLIKRRAVAREACLSGAVSVNGRPVKPGGEVAVGDRITLALGRRVLTVRVLALGDNPPAAEAAKLYAVLSDGRQGPR